MSSIESQAQPAPTAPDYELAQFFDFARDLFCIVGFDGYYKLVNASFERVLGYSRAEILSRPIMDFVHPDDLQRAIDVMSVLADGEDVIGFESRLICADGSVRRFEWNTRTMPGRGVVYGIARDVTERTALAEEQAALRRVATLVARESRPDPVFAAVVEEVGRIVDVDSAAMLRYEDDGTATPVASWGAPPIEDDLCSRVFATAQPARVDRTAGAARSAVGAPITVDGRLWGAMIAVAAEPLPDDTASRMAQFTELVATAIANIDARAELTASRARIVAAAHEERRRVVRDLHDGAQQRLVHAIITLKLARQALEPADGDAVPLVDEALDHAQRAKSELRELAHGILPRALSVGGLRAGVGALASRMPVPVELDVCAERLPATVEATAYFVVAEALTNVAKHARAVSAAVNVRVVDGTLEVEVRDDGVGGVRPEGSGLQGLVDRVAALDGRLRIESPAAGGTLVATTIPVAGAG
jgi:PAS domain S-box-containing protein